jgi:tRNA 2-thiouridine synthesizing protein A
MTELDCRGLACPQPVLNTKDALDQMESGQLTIIVDNPAARDNVSRFASSQGCQVETKDQAGAFVLTITKGSACTAIPSVDTGPEVQGRIPVVVVKVVSPFMGSGSEELGRILMKAFLKTLAEATHQPTAVVFYNSGILLTCNGSENLDSLRALEKSGVRILSCGTCLDFFNKKEELAVGAVTNMFEIIETLSGADRVVSP